MPSLQYKLFHKIISILPLKARLQILYFRRFKKLCNFNTPITFNEKIQLRKICDRNELLTIAADKIQSKEFVKKICPELYIPKNLWSSDDINNIDESLLSHLPKNYVFKSNHTSQTIKIIKNSEHLNILDMKKLARSWLKQDQAGALGEWAYKNISKCIFIEEYLNFEGKEPDDYKFFVFHGKVYFIQLDSDRFIDHKRNIFDPNWNELNFEYSHPRKFPIPDKPEYLNSMICIAEKIGQHFDFIRVDLYFFKKQVTFGELTVYPGAGFEKFPDKKWDIFFGKYWHQKYLK
ncbi:ATP-grasp fold amidoligase family protein [Xenorhabdus anantnagensis]|uniref:ATP-grasp fold amidoligase family protein n=1 Tax=Xenorhabdus anantnagensis TaxID=3025875 RepID=A0ABT5LQY0_9GAMM|nr:ATP-grasp fold amidoligase family protein [Xenorhabdus anantnagensis]MDC9596814.1 ATP-grasp fold amidoligase family protein [Xenorhabdus anantnagensis]